MKYRTVLVLNLVHCSLLKGCHNSEGGGGLLLYIGYIGMCGPKGYGFSVILVINRVSILAILARNRAWFLELSMFFLEEAPFYHYR